MQKLSVNFEYCYGIKRLNHEFKFSNRTFAIYAPNGVMKTSFSKIFKDYSVGNETKDLAFPNRVTRCSIQKDDNSELSQESILIIEPYNEDYQSDKISTLLANKKLKTEYDRIHQKIDEAKKEFVKKVKQLSGLTGRTDNIEKEIEKIFGDNFYDVLLNLEAFVNANESLAFHDIVYREIFNDTVLKFLATKNFKKEIEEYIQRYDELLEKSTYLKKEFNFYHVETVQKQLGTNNFFKVGHSVNLYDGETKQEYTNEESLKDLIETEKKKVFDDDTLKQKFEAIDSKLSNADLRQFRDFLLDNQEILPFLVNLEEFSIILWKAYIVNQKELYNLLLQEYKSGSESIKALIEKANQEHTDWEEAIYIFNNRFVHLPFYLQIKNKVDVILQNEVPTAEFVFKDSGDERVYQQNEKKELLNILSTGEKRALYILNIIFEVEARKKQSIESLFIVDDIADSFDYKNKYAIIDYLRYVSEVDHFYMMILTHNFDFFRTIASRNIAPYSQCLFAIKTADEIKLEKAKYLKNPFINDWKNHLDDNKKLIASIPFIRNIIEYTDGENAEYGILTSLLHCKNNTAYITINDIKNIFISTIPSLSFVNNDLTKPITELIYETADECLEASEGINLENKIVLSIAIRLKAEIFMKEQINDEVFLLNLENNYNQTWQLLNKYTETFNNENRVIDILKRVQLITPENIHINSFMYEPILDMGDYELRKLYTDVKNIHSLLIVNNVLEGQQ